MIQVSLRLGLLARASLFFLKKSTCVFSSCSKNTKRKLRGVPKISENFNFNNVMPKYCNNKCSENYWGAKSDTKSNTKSNALASVVSRRLYFLEYVIVLLFVEGKLEANKEEEKKEGINLEANKEEEKKEGMFLRHSWQGLIVFIDSQKFRETQSFRRKNYSSFRKTEGWRACFRW